MREVEELLAGVTDDGAVHHQGDVYGCTLAALPFLVRIAADTGRSAARRRLSRPRSPRAIWDRS